MIRLMSDWPEYIYDEDEWPEELGPSVAPDEQPPQFCSELGLLAFEFEHEGSPLSRLEVEISTPWKWEVKPGDPIKIYGVDYKVLCIKSVSHRLRIHAKIYRLLLEPV